MDGDQRRLWPEPRKDVYERVHHCDRENNITVFASSKDIEATGGEREIFSSPEDLAAFADYWSGTRLVEIWNGLPGVEPVQRFTSRKVAVARIWKAIQQLKPGEETPANTMASKTANANQKKSRTASSVAAIAMRSCALVFEPADDC